MSKVVDYYEVLGVSRGAGPEGIARAFKSQMHTSHPDRPGGSEELARMLIQAREILRDPAKRQAYDSFLRRAEVTPTRRRPRPSHGRHRTTSRRAAEEATRRAAEREAAQKATDEASRKAAEREAARRAAQHEAARRVQRRHQGTSLWDIVGAIVVGGGILLGAAAVAEACMSDD